MPAGPCSRWTMRKSSCSPLSRPRRGRRCRPSGCSIDVYGPHENQRVTSGSQASSSSAGASARSGRRRVSVGPCNAMLALLFDIHGNLPALEAVLDDARGRGADRWLLGGDYAVFGGWPAETVARLRELQDATWIRGNVDRWAASEAPDGDPRAAASSARAMLDAARSTSSARCPRAPASATARAPGTPRPRPTSSPSARARRRRPELLDGVTDRRLVFGHFHVSFDRIGARGVELVTPGSVGLPLDGDHRAAYALLDDDGRSSAAASPTTGRPRRARARGRRRRPVGRGHRRAHRAGGVGLAARAGTIALFGDASIRPAQSGC